MPRRRLTGEIEIQARDSVGRYNERGKWELAYLEPRCFPATVNPIPGDVLQTLPEGERLGRQYRVLSTVEPPLVTTDEASGRRGSEVLIDGDWFEVRDSQVYPTVIPHREYRVRRLNVGG
jgi:hypothetical protein